MKTKRITRAAMLLALTLVFQSLRFYIPVTPFASTILIGSLVNSCLLISTITTGLGSAVLISVVAPLVAYFQQLLPIPVFVLPVACGNIIYVLVFQALKKRHGLAVVAAAGAKTGVLYFSFVFLAAFFTLPGKIIAPVLFIMSWPQFITGLAGGIIGWFVLKRLPNGF